MSGIMRLLAFKIIISLFTRQPGLSLGTDAFCLILSRKFTLRLFCLGIVGAQYLFRYASTHQLYVPTYASSSFTPSFVLH